MRIEPGRSWWLLITALLLSGCARQTEEQRLAKFRDSLRYKAYGFSSEKTIRLAVAECEKKGGEPVTQATLHATLGLLWFLAQKPEYAFVEAELAAAGASPEGSLFSLGVQAMALTEMNCPEQAKRRYDELKRELGTSAGSDTNRVGLEHQAMLLGLVAVGVYYRDPGLASVGADALGRNPQLDYLPLLVGAVSAAQQGQPRQAVTQLQQAYQSERFSAQSKAVLVEVSELLARCPEQAKFGDDGMRQVLARTADGVLDEVFRGEALHAVLASFKELSLRLVGNKNVEMEETAEAGPGAADPGLPPVLLSDELRAQGVAVTALRYSHGIHGDSTLLALVTLEAKTGLVAALELRACNISSNVLKKSMLCLRPSPQTSAYTFMLPGMLNSSYVPREPIAYFYLTAVTDGDPEGLPGGGPQAPHTTASE